MGESGEYTRVLYAGKRPSNAAYQNITPKTTRIVFVDDVINYDTHRSVKAKPPGEEQAFATERFSVLPPLAEDSATMVSPIMRRGGLLIAAGFLPGLALLTTDAAHGTAVAAEPVGSGEFSLAAGFDPHIAEPSAGAEASDSGMTAILLSCADDADEPERRSALCADTAVGNLADAGFPLIGSASRPSADLGAAAHAVFATSVAFATAPMQTPFAGVWSMANGGSLQFMAEMDPGPVATRVDFAAVHNGSGLVGYVIAALAAFGGLLGGWLFVSRRRRAALVRHRSNRHRRAAGLLRTD